MTQKFDLKQVYTIDDLKKLQQAGASAEELHQAHQMMTENNQQREEVMKKLAELKEDTSLAKVKDLLEQGADVNVKNWRDWTVLPKAAEGRMDEIQPLIEKGFDLNAKDEDGKTALDYAKGEQLRKLLGDASKKEETSHLTQTLSGLKEKNNKETDSSCALSGEQTRGNDVSAGVVNKALRNGR